MREAVGPIYNTLYEVIQDLAGNSLKEFDRGFWYRGEDCEKDASLFPYAFLHQPSAGLVSGESSPAGYQYGVSVPLVVLTMADAGDRSGLYFDGNSDNMSPGAIELCHTISRAVWDRYIWGLPFQPAPTDWSVNGWTLGPLGSPNIRELDNAGFLKSPFIAGAMTSFIFSVHEAGPLPVGQSL